MREIYFQGQSRKFHKTMAEILDIKKVQRERSEIYICPIKARRK